MYGADQLFGIWCDIGEECNLGTTISRIVGEFSNWNAADDREVEWLIVDLRSAYSTTTSVRLIMGQCTQPARTEDDTDHSHGCTPWYGEEWRGLVVVGRCIKTRPRSIIRNSLVEQDVPAWFCGTALQRPVGRLLRTGHGFSENH